MNVVKLPLGELRKPERNVRLHSNKQISEFKRSVEMFGQIRPIVVDESHTILAGNGLFDALKALGRTDADCYVVTGLTAAEKKKLMLADNRIFNLGIDDVQAFDDIIAELEGDVDIPGYDPELLRTITADVDIADDIICGYGTIGEETRVTMQQASADYARREESFAQEAQRIDVPNRVGNRLQLNPTVLSPQGIWKYHMNKHRFLSLWGHRNGSSLSARSVVNGYGCKEDLWQYIRCRCGETASEECLFQWYKSLYVLFSRKRQLVYVTHCLRPDSTR